MARDNDRIAKLAGKSEPAAQSAAADLYAAYVGDGRWPKGAAHATSALLATLAKSARTSWVLVTIADIVGADHVRGWLASAKEDASAKDVRRALDATIDAPWRAATSKDPNDRASALVVLAMLSDVSSADCAKVIAIAEKDSDDVVRASAILALARLGEVHDRARAVVRAALDDPSATVHGAAAIATLRLDPTQSIDALARGIEAWLAQPAPPDWFGHFWADAGTRRTRMPWFGGVRMAMVGWNCQLATPPAHALIALARHQKREDAMLRCALVIARRSTEPAVTHCVGRIVLGLGGFARFAERNRATPFVALPGELTKQERALAELLGDTMLLPLGGFGLPAAGATRKRWLGLLPSSGSEKIVKYKTNGRAVSNPVWRAWLDLEATRTFGDPFPPPIDAALEGFDRWHAFVDNTSRSYGGPWSDAEIDVVESELARTRFDTSKLSLIADVANDLAARFEAAEREGIVQPPTFAMSSLLLLPFVRTKQPIAPRWERLVSLEDNDVTREILGAIPPARREALLFSRLPRDDGHDSVIAVTRLIDVAPSKRILDALATHLANPDMRRRLADFDVLDELERKLAQSAHHP
jgi:hypothetical protein